MIVTKEMREFGITGSKEDWGNMMDEIYYRYTFDHITDVHLLSQITRYAIPDIKKALVQMNLNSE